MSMMAPPVPGTATPILRGYLHLAGAIVAPFALLHLLFIADSPRGVVGGAIFGASLVILYSTSAAYHLLPLGRRFRGVIKRLDHSNIFLFIAGTYTPFVLKLMSDAWGIPVLSVVGGLALVGFITTLAAPAPPHWIRVGSYLALGWVGLAAISELLTALPGDACVCGMLARSLPVRIVPVAPVAASYSHWVERRMPPAGQIPSRVFSDTTKCSTRCKSQPPPWSTRL